MTSLATNRRTVSMISSAGPRGRWGSVAGAAAPGHGGERYIPPMLTSISRERRMFPMAGGPDAPRPANGPRCGSVTATPCWPATTSGRSADLDELSNAFGRHLVGRGVGPGDRVAVMTSNRPEFVVAIHAISKLGAAAVLLSPAWKAVEVEPRAGAHRARPRRGRRCGRRPAGRAARRRAGSRDLDEPDAVDAPFDAGRAADRRRSVRATATRRCWSSARGRPDCPRRSGTRTGRWAVPRRTGAHALGLGPDDRFQVATPPSHILGLLNLLAAASAGATVRLHRAVRPRRGAAPDRVGADDPRDGGGADRAGHGQPPGPRALRPLLAALHHVGGDAGERARGPERDRAHRGAVAAGLRGQRAARHRRAIRSADPAHGGSTRPGSRPRASSCASPTWTPARSCRPGETGEIQVRSPSVMAGLPPRRGDGRRVRRRVVPDGRRRLARTRRMGPPDRPVQGDDQGQRVPGGTGRGRGGAARPPVRARLRRVRADRRTGGRGTGRRRAARPGATASPPKSSRSWWPDRSPPTSRCATWWSSTPSPGCLRGRCCAARSATSGPPIRWPRTGTR